MSENEKILVYPDPLVVQDVVDSVDRLICSKDVRIVDSLTSLIIIIISRAQNAGMSKGEILGYISNSWELNDPENDSPERNDCFKINY